MIVYTETGMGVFSGNHVLSLDSDDAQNDELAKLTAEFEKFDESKRNEEFAAFARVQLVSEMTFDEDESVDTNLAAARTAVDAMIKIADEFHCPKVKRHIESFNVKLRMFEDAWKQLHLDLSTYGLTKRVGDHGALTLSFARHTGRNNGKRARIEEESDDESEDESDNE